MRTLLAVHLGGLSNGTLLSYDIPIQSMPATSHLLNLIGQRHILLTVSMSGRIDQR
jgi:hypothetical protein